MAAKPESKELVPEKPAGDKAAPEAPAAAKKPSALGAWIPAIAAILLAPIASIAVAQFVLLPRLQKKLAAPPVAADGTAPAAPAEAPAPAEGSGGAKPSADGKTKDAGNSYDFINVVVNLSGTMGTRYLKTTFTVTGSDAGLKQLFESNKPRLTDVTLNVLSALSLTELEEPGSKNVIRDKLVAAYNQALGRHIAEQVYFADFLIQ